MALTVDNKASRLFKALMGVSETRTIRDFFEEPIRTAASVLPSQVWKYGDSIPDGSEDTGGEEALEAIRDLPGGALYEVQFDESTVRPIVKRWKNLHLTMIDGATHNSFQAMSGDTPIQNIIPFNYGDGFSYNYNLYKADGSPIAFGVGDWVFDTASGVLTFYGAVPSGVDADHPPQMSFFQYVGGQGIPETVSGFEGIVVPITDVMGAGNLTAWNTAAHPDIAVRINEALNKAWPDFVNTFDWNGNDDNEGVAVEFEKMIPLRFSHSFNPVKSGVGMSADSEVVSLIARRHINTNVPEGTGFKVDFASQKTPTAGGQVVLRYSGGGLSVSIDGGTNFGPVVPDFNTLSTNGAVRVSNGSMFLIVRRTPGNLPTGQLDTTLGISDNETTLGFFYWDTETNEYVPWLNKDPQAKYDLGVPIVLKLGKIPASIKLSQMGSGGFADTITPEYYGVRAETVVVAVKSDITADNTPLPEGVDYLVRNEPNHYLENILAKILADRGAAFGGKILLRAGRYKVSGDFSLANLRTGWKIEGEARDAVSITPSDEVVRTITVTADTHHCNVYFENLRFVGRFDFNVIHTGTNIGYLSLMNVWAPETDVAINDQCNVTILNCPALRDLSIFGNTGVLGDRLVSTSTLRNISHNGTKTIFRGITAQTFTGLGGGVQSWIDSSYIHVLASLDLNNQFSNNTILSYDEAVDERFRMETGFIEVIDSTDGAGERRWTTFADPIVYDIVTKRFELRIDDRTMEVVDGELIVKAAADVITFDATGVYRPYANYEEGTDGPPVTATNVQEALEDLYRTKADLIAGKLPLQQLPEAVAHGGLKFKGMWSFETSNGAYPSPEDVEDYDVDGVTEWPDGIQPGWFLVVKNSTEENNPAAPQQAVLQAGESDALVFTAGDWVIFNGTKWEKVDNSVANAVFSILPDKPPSREGADWDEASGGPGLLALGNTTLVDGIDLVNEILRKLAPPKPVNLSQMNLILRSASGYTAREAGTGVSRNLVFDNRRVSYGTPGNATNNSGTVNDLFYDGDGGTLRAFIDNVEVGTRVLSPASDVGTFGAMQITADADPHFGVSGQEDFWKGLRARINPTEDLDLGPHNYKLGHTTSGEAESPTFYVDNPAPTGGMTLQASLTISSPPESAYHVSGAPSIAASSVFNLASFMANNVVGRFYNNTAVVTIGCSVPNVSTQNLLPAITPDLPPDGTYTDASMPATTFTMPTAAYSESVVFTYTPRNTRNQNGTARQISTTRRIDTISEHSLNAYDTQTATRVFSGTPSAKFPAIGTSASQCGGPFVSTQSLVAGEYVGELQRIGKMGGPGNSQNLGVYRWPSGNYTDFGGPNYTDAAGVTVDGTPYRWVTFRLPNIFSNTSAFTLEYLDPLGGWTADGNRITANMMIFIRVAGGSSGTGWLNANAPYPGAGIPVEDNAPAMVASESTASIKRITFGPQTRSGDLYIRTAITSSGRTFRGIKIDGLA